jgi:lipopolysaccharide biosynthesis glycosyltransferase
VKRSRHRTRDDRLGRFAMRATIRKGEWRRACVTCQAETTEYGLSPSERYLDTDMVVRADLSALWATSLEGCPVGAVQNHLPSRVGEANGVVGHGALGISPSEPYLNSGLLLVDIPAWREARVEERALEYVRSYPGQLHYGDQDALNAALAGRWRRLPLQWNVMTTVYWLHSWPDSPLKCEVEAREWELLHAPKVVHYVGKPKPWMPDCRHPLRGLYLHHLKASD